MQQRLKTYAMLSTVVTDTNFVKLINGCFTGAKL